MIFELRQRARAAVGPRAMLKLDRGAALFITNSAVCPPGFRQETRGALFALAPQTDFSPETERIWIALLKQTASRDSRFPALVKAARNRMALCLRTGEADAGLSALEALIEQIEEGSS